MKVKMTIDTERCKGCALCVSVCPLKIMEIDVGLTNKKGYHAARSIDIGKCTACGSCAITCPDGVITIEKETDGGQRKEDNGKGFN